MSLPPKVVPKPAAVAVSGPGSGPSPSSQLRATLTSVSLPPGAPTAPQPGAVPPPQYPFDSGKRGKRFVMLMHFSPVEDGTAHRCLVGNRGLVGRRGEEEGGSFRLEGAGRGGDN